MAGLGSPPGLNLAGATGPGGLNLTTPNDPALAGMYTQSPGYQYNLQQQQQAIQNSAAGKTGALSGNMLQALQQNASGLANQDFQQFYQNLTGGQLQGYNANTQAQTANFNAGNANYWNQYDAANQNQTNTFDRLFNLSQLGQSAAAGAGNTGAALAGNIGQAQIGQGNAIAAGQIGGAQALTSGINNALGNFNTYGGSSGFNPSGFLAPLFSGGGGYPGYYQSGQGYGPGGSPDVGTGGNY